MTFPTAFTTGDREEPDDVDRIPCVLERVDARHEDMFWRSACPQENYFRTDLDYEDYAPAYCVGYIGFAQYGGSYEDAQRCLWANWARIKGDSRLSMDDARMAMRAAWSRMETLQQQDSASEPEAFGLSLSQAVA